MDVSHMREVLVLAEHLNFTIDVALVYQRENTNPNIARLAACIPDIRQHVM